MVLHAGKWIRALERIIHIQYASAHGVYLGVDVFIPFHSCRKQNCLLILGKQPTWIDTDAIMLDDTLLLTVYGLVLVIMTSCAHCHTIIHIQSYRYKHTHTTMQWCRTQVRDAFPWEVVQTHKVQVFTLHTFVFTIRSCCWQDCLWICGKQPTWTHTHAIIVDYTFLLVVYGLVVVMTTSHAHCHTIIHIQPYSHTHTTMQRCCTQVNESGPWKELYTYNVQVLTVST